MQDRRCFKDMMCIIQNKIKSLNDKVEEIKVAHDTKALEVEYAHKEYFD